MATFDYRELSPEARKQMLEHLADVFATLKTKEKVVFLLQRLLTESEQIMLARRLQIAELLVGGRTYDQIQKKLSVGVSTIRGVDRWLTDAAYEYHLVCEYNRADEQGREHARRVRQRSGKLLDGPTVPDEIKRLVRGDSRMILIRLLLGDF